MRKVRISTSDFHDSIHENRVNKYLFTVFDFSNSVSDFINRKAYFVSLGPETYLDRFLTLKLVGIDV